MFKFIKRIFNIDIKRSFFFVFIQQYLKLKKIIYYYFFSNNKADFYFKSLLQPTQFIGKGKILIDESSQIGVWPSPQLLSSYAYLEARNESALITIGKKTFINNSATIIADKSSISIGDNCLIGQNVNIFDSDFHGLEIENRNTGKHDCLPVTIHDDVFIGANVTILKGVNIGYGSVIANGSIVIKDVEPYSVVAGVPAKKIRSLNKYS